MSESRGEPKSKLKILFFVPTLAGGGAEKHVVRVASYLADHSVDVTILVARTGGAYEDQLSSRVSVVGIGPNRIRSCTLSVLACVFPLLRYLRANPFDFFVPVLNLSVLLGALCFPRQKGKQMVALLQNNLTAEIDGSPLLLRLLRRPIHAAYAECNGLICLSHGVETVSYTHLTLPTSDLV